MSYTPKPTAPRFRSIQIKRLWSIPEDNIEIVSRFPVGDLLREGGWMLIGCRPCEVQKVLKMVEGWKLEFGTLAFRKHMPYGTGRGYFAWKKTKSHILREDLQEVIVIAFKPPMNWKGLRRWAAKARQFFTNFPTRWEYNEYWKMSQLWGYPRLEICARKFEGTYPKGWTRIGPHLDGMPLEQSLTLQYLARCSTRLDSSWLDSVGGL